MTGPGQITEKWCLRRTTSYRFFIEIAFSATCPFKALSHVFRAFLQFQMSLGDFHVCRRAIFPVRVTLFPSRMLHITNIRSRYRIHTSLCSELNGEHVGEGFDSIWQIVFEIWLCKVKKLPISLKFYLCPRITGSNFDLLSKKKRTTTREYSSWAVRCFFFR